MSGVNFGIGPIRVDKNKPLNGNIAEMQIGPIKFEKEKKTVKKEDIEKKQEDWGTLSPIVVTKIKNAGFNSLEELKGKSKEELVAINGIGDQTADYIVSLG